MMTAVLLNRALEASAEENAARMKRKRCEGQGEMCSPADWIRQGDWPVGIRNVGNTCWFSAVIQVRTSRAIQEIKKTCILLLLLMHVSLVNDIYSSTRI